MNRCGSRVLTWNLWIKTYQHRYNSKQNQVRLGMNKYSGFPIQEQKLSKNQLEMFQKYWILSGKVDNLRTRVVLDISVTCYALVQSQFSVTPSVPVDWRILGIICITTTRGEKRLRQRIFRGCWLFWSLNGTSLWSTFYWKGRINMAGRVTHFFFLVPE